MLDVGTNKENGVQNFVFHQSWSLTFKPVTAQMSRLRNTAQNLLDGLLIYLA